MVKFLFRSIFISVLADKTFLWSVTRVTALVSAAVVFFGRKIKIYSVYACKISAVFCVNYLPYNVSACSVLCLFCYVFCICLSPACLATVQYWCPHWPSCHCYHHGWRSFEKGFFSGEVSILYKLFSDILLILVVDAYSQVLSR